MYQKLISFEASRERKPNKRHFEHPLHCLRDIKRLRPEKGGKMQKREKIGIRTSLMFDEKLKILKFSQHVATQT